MVRSNFVMEAVAIVTALNPSIFQIENFVCVIVKLFK